ncbi:MAG: AIM24 family protein [Prolixibacteraceae bacterium]|jgi:uncharacterized protein (AIM24 family)|nr:AIM24 family protein [Prolixibacteraceae bacterium]
MSFCSFCGNQIIEGAVFCANCGKPVAHNQSVPPPVPPVTPPPIPHPQPTPVPLPQTGSIKFEIIEKERLNMVRAELKNSAFRYESGGLHYMQGALELESNVPGAGSILKSMVTREKIVKPVISGTGEVFLEPSFGNFTILDLKDEEWILDRGAYVASEMGIEIGAYSNKAVSALFSGEKWFQTAVSGTGKVIIRSAGPLQEINMVNDKLVVDGAFAVARTSGIDLQVKKATKGIFSTMVSGEGIVNTFTGTGKVLIAPVENYVNTLIHIVRGIDYKIQRLGNKS